MVSTLDPGWCLCGARQLYSDKEHQNAHLSLAHIFSGTLGDKEHQNAYVVTEFYAILSPCTTIGIYSYLLLVSPAPDISCYVY